MGSVSLVIVSHSRKLADGVIELARQMAGPSVHIAACGGIGEDLGTCAPDILQIMLACPEDRPILLLFDIGSAYMNCETAIQLAPESVRQRTDVVDAPLVEATIAASMASRLEQSPEKVKAVALEARHIPKVIS